MMVLGCEHVMRFPTAKLLDFEPQLSELPHHANPFALVTAAHLSALRTRADVDRRLAAKRQLVRLLYRQGWGKQRVLDLFAVLDWMLRLPPPQEHQVWQDIEAIERSAGPDWASARLQAADVSQLEQWADRVLDAPSLEAVFIGH
jgi:hypothetical protein